MIINHRNSSMDRQENLMSVISYFKNICEIIVVEQDDSSKISLSPDIKHIFVKNNGLFNRSWGFNIGVKYASFDKICFNDNDIFMDIADFTRGIDGLNDCDTINPYSAVYDLDQGKSLDFKRYGTFPTMDGFGRGGTNYSGGMLFMNKNNFYKIGGWDEQMRGWGGEDDLMTHKIFNLLSSRTLEQKAYHLYHSRGINDNHLHTHYHINLNRLGFIRSLTGSSLLNEVEKYQIGDENKYIREN